MFISGIASGATAQNAFVSVQCNSPGVTFLLEGPHIQVMVPNLSDTEKAHITLTAENGWSFPQSPDNTRTLCLEDGESLSVEIKQEPEDEIQITVSVTGYHIRSDKNNGSTQLRLPQGESVTFTSYLENSPCLSCWRVNGIEMGKSSSISFHGKGTDTSWFTCDVKACNPGIFNLHACNVKYPEMTDDGFLAIVGVKSVSGGGVRSVKNTVDECTINETIYIQSGEGVSVPLFAEPTPDEIWPSGWPVWSISDGKGLLCNLQSTGTVSGVTSVSVDASDPAEYGVMVSCGESTKAISVIPFQLSLTLSQDNLVLLHKNQSDFTISVIPESVPLENPSFQIIRDDIGVLNWPNWETLCSDSLSLSYIARIAGMFRVRARVEIGGKEFFTEEKSLIVNFPSYEQIIANPFVKQAIDSAWQATLDDCTPEKRRERGFWVSIDTAGDGFYVIGDTLYGEWCTATNRGSIHAGKRPGDPLSSHPANDESGRYGLAFFHTHTSTEFLLEYNGRKTGPSLSDYRNSIKRNSIGIVYDYSRDVIPGGYPKNSPARMYSTIEHRLLTAE